MNTLIPSIIPEENNVQREVGSSIVIFDAIAVLIWIGAIIYNKQWKPLLFCGIGFVVYYLVDAIIWMTIMKVRWVKSSFNEYLIQIWLQLGPGIIHPSFVCLMFEGTFGPKRKTTRREFWVLLFLLVQFTPAFLQSSFPGNSMIYVGRTMTSQRWFFIFLGILGYLVLVYEHVSVKNLWKIFLICTGVETCFEFSLYLSGIRKASLQTILVDSVIEYNVGAAITLLLWRCMYTKEECKKMDFGPDAFATHSAVIQEDV